MDKLLLKVSEAAALASISKVIAYELINKGEWPVVRIPGTTAVRVSRADLEEWIAAHTTRGPASAQQPADR